MKLLRFTIITLILLGLGAFIYFSSGTDPQQWLLEFMEKWDSRYLWIILIIFVITLLSTLTGLPVLYLGVALGFFMAYLPALALAWVINVIAVMAAFFMIRKVFSSYFRQKYGDKKLILRINRAITKYNFWTVAFTRSIYIIPTNLINFSFPLSKISGRHYFLGTLLGLIPESLINVSTGYLLKHELLLMTSPGENLIKIIIIGSALLAMTGGFLLLRYTRRRRASSSIEEIVPLLEDN